MKITPNRLGNAAPAGVSPNARNDSSHGSAMVTPAPRSTARREMRSAILFRRFGISIPSMLRRTLRPCRFHHRPAALVAELRAAHDTLHQRREPVAVGRHPAAHLLHQGLVGKLQ